MRMKMLSALSIFVWMVCSSRPVAAQTSSSLPSMPQAFAQKLQQFNKPAVLQKSVEDTNAQVRSNLENAARALVRSLGTSERQLDGTRETKILPAPLEANSCGHMMIFEAPAMDSKMIQEVPKEFASNMPKIEAMQPCAQDMPKAIMTLRGAPLVNPDKPFVIIPKPVTAPRP
jgi:hypothetical protein